jgi:hypothetical protein
MTAFASDRLPPDLAPLVIRESDPHVSSGGGTLGGGLAVINPGPPTPISEAFLERIRELANSAAADDKRPQPQA